MAAPTHRPEAGIALHTQVQEGSPRPILAPDSGDFAKWMAAEHPEITVELPEAEHLALHSHDVWLPLVTIAADVTVQTFLGILSSYLYDRFKGALSRLPQPQVNFSLEYVANEDGEAKRLEFKGDADSFAELVEKFDGNRFLGG